MTLQNAAFGTIRAVALSCVAMCLNGPALAQSIAPSDFIALLISTCNDLETQPDAILADAFNSETSSASRTSDGAILSMNGAEETDVGILQYNGGRNEYDGGITIHCGASIYGTNTPINALAFADLLDIQAAGILGETPATAGSTVITRDQLGLMRQWATPGFPPSATISLFSSDAFLLINIVRHIPD